MLALIYDSWGVFISGSGGFLILLGIESYTSIFAILF